MPSIRSKDHRPPPRRVNANIKHPRNSGNSHLAYSQPKFALERSDQIALATHHISIARAPAKARVKRPVVTHMPPTNSSKMMKKVVSKEGSNPFLANATAA